MARIYKCELCGEEIRVGAVPGIIARERLCVKCYQMKYRALGAALKERRTRVNSYTMRRKGKLIHVKSFLRKRPKKQK